MTLVDGAYSHEFSDHYFYNDYESNRSLTAKLMTKRSEAGIAWSASDFRAQSQKVGRGSGENQVAISYNQSRDNASPTRLIEQKHVVDLHSTAGGRLKNLHLTGLQNAVFSSNVDYSAIAGCFSNDLFIEHSKF